MSIKQEIEQAAIATTKCPSCGAEPHQPSRAIADARLTLADFAKSIIKSFDNLRDGNVRRKKLRLPRVEKWASPAS